MTLSPPSDSTGSISEHKTSVERLAGQYVSSRHDAEDVAQEVWLEYLSKSPERVRSLPAWLRTVTARVARRAMQRDRNRYHREKLVARFDREASLLDRLERRAIRDLLLSEVDRLRDPYREVIQRRYVEEQEIEEISSALDRPAATIRSQLKRGLAQLRDRLSPSFEQDRAAWNLSSLALWIPWKSGRGPHLSIPTTVGIVSGAAVLAILAGAWFARDGRTAEAPSQTAALVDSREEVPHSDSDLEHRRAPLVRTPSGTAPADTGSPLLGSVGTRSLEGTVRSLDGRPTAAEIVVVDESGSVEEVRTEADGDGYFRLEGLAPNSWVYARWDPWSPSNAHRVSSLGRAQTLELHLSGRGRTLSGAVLAPDGTPVPDAEVQLMPTIPTEAFLGAQGTLERPWTTARTFTGPLGEFELLRPATRGTHVLVQARGYAPWTGVLPTGELDELVVQLDEPGRLQGNVSFGNDQADDGIGATLHFEPPFPLPRAEAPIQADGSFDLTNLPACRADVSMKGVEGRRGLHLGDVEIESGRITFLNDLELGEASTLRGRVLDVETREPLRDMRVLLRAEGGAHHRAAIFETAVDRAGVFSFPGLADEPYELFLISREAPRGLAVAKLAGVRPGSDVELLTGSPMHGVQGGFTGTSELHGLELTSATQTFAPVQVPLDESLGFSVRSLPPGSYSLHATLPTRGRWHVADFRIDETDVDLGNLPIPAPSSVTFQIEGLPNGAFHKRFSLRLRGEGVRIDVRPKQPTTRASFEANRIVVEDLVPGTYSYSIGGAEVAHRFGTVQVTAGADELVPIRTMPGTRRSFEVTAPRPLHPGEDLEVFLEQGDEVTQLIAFGPVSPTEPDRISSFQLTLEPGTYRLVVRTSDGMHAELELPEDSLLGLERPAVLELLPRH